MAEFVPKLGLDVLRITTEQKSALPQRDRIACLTAKLLGNLDVYAVSRGRLMSLSGGESRHKVKHPQKPLEMQAVVVAYYERENGTAVLSPRLAAGLFNPEIDALWLGPEVPAVIEIENVGKFEMLKIDSEDVLRAHRATLVLETIAPFIPRNLFGKDLTFNILNAIQSAVPENIKGEVSKVLGPRIGFEKSEAILSFDLSSIPPRSLLDNGNMPINDCTVKIILEKMSASW